MNDRRTAASWPTHRGTRTRIALLMAAAISLIGLASCTHDEAEGAHEKVTFTVTSPLIKDTSTIREYVCQIHAIQHIELRALERGYLEKILVDEGETVRKGQPMFQIMPVIYQAEYQHAQAEARVAEIEYRNTKSLADSNVVSQNELAMAKAKYDQALARLSLAKAHLDFTKISAPFTGIMDRLQVRHGSLLEEGDILSALSDNSSMWVYFNVPEAQYLNYKSHARGDHAETVRLKMANGQLFDLPGEVTTIEADFNNETGNIAFRATFPNPKGLLRHGETGNIQMTDVLPHAMMIPQKATFEVLDKKFVYVIDKQGHVRSRHITIRAELPHVYVVGDGLASDDRILLEGLRKVKEGQKVDVKYVQPSDVMTELHLHAE